MRHRVLVAVFAVLLGPANAFAQGQIQLPPIDFSGLLFLNYQMRTDSAAKLTAGNQAPNKFDVERVYLIFRMPAGDKGSIRVTTDVFQSNTAGYYTGWTVRLKHGYFQYNWTQNFLGVKNMPMATRLGMLHTVILDHVETFWTRYLGNSGMERFGFFSTADVGLASLVTLPNRKGEVYATITNGANYTSGETDRFKDYAARFSFTPFGADSGWFRTFTITPWYYKGAAASAYVGAPNFVGEGLQKDRRGLFVGLRDRRVVAGANWAQRIEGVETAPPTRTVTTRTSQLVDGFALVRPFEIANRAKRSPFGIVARLDKFKLDKDAPVSAGNPASTYTIVGVFYDLNQRVTFALDRQELARDGSASGTVPTRTLFLHGVVNF